MAHSQQALAHHRQVMDMQQNMAQNMASMMSNMTPTVVQQTPQQPQIAWQTVSPQLQIANQQGVQQQQRITYGTASPQPQVGQQQPQITHQQGVQQQHQIAYQPASPQGQVVQHGLPQQPQIAYRNASSTVPQQQRPASVSPMNLQPQSQYPQDIYQQPQQSHGSASQFPQTSTTNPGMSQPQSLIQQYPQQASNVQSPQAQQLAQRPSQPSSQDDRFDALDEQRKRDLENMNRAGAQISQRLRDIEQFNSRAQSDQEAKDREVRRLQEQLAAVNRQRFEDSERNSQQLAELVRSQAASPPNQTPAFDMSALQKVIRETQARQLSAADIERVIEEQVSKRLSGMATKADIQNAGAQMQSALSQVPAGLNEQQVQQAVNRELNNVMQSVADRVNQQRRLAGQMPQDIPPAQRPQSHVHTELVIEELPDDDDDVEVHRAAGHDSTSHVTLPVTQLQGTVPYLPPGVSTASAAPIVPGQRSLSTQNPGAGSQQRALEASSAQQNVPQRSLTLMERPGTQSQTVSSRPQSAALEAPPAPSNVLGSAQALVNRPVVTPTADSTYRPNAPHPSLAPRQIQVATPQRQLEAAPLPVQQLQVATPQLAFSQNQGAIQGATQPRRIQAAMPQTQLEAAPTPLQQHGLAARPAIQHAQGSAHMAGQPRHIEAAASHHQRQLEAAPVSSQQFQIAGTPYVGPQYRGVAQDNPQQRQIEANASLRQLEAPTTNLADVSTRGNELVHQSRDIARNLPRK